MLECAVSAKSMNDRCFVCRFFVFLLLLTVSSAVQALDTKQKSEAEAIIARAEKLSSLTQAGSSPFYLQAEISHAASKLTGSKGVYQIWWAANDSWREEADADNLRGVQIRDSRGLWAPDELDPKLAAVFLDGQGYPFRGELLRWNEEIVGLEENKIDGTHVSCVETASPNLRRELCFDASGGLLVKITSEVTLLKWQTLAFEPDTSTQVPLSIGMANNYLGEVPSPKVKFVTRYAGYAAIGDKTIPTEIRHTFNGKLIMIWKLVRIAPNPKPPFTPATFAVPTKYQLWAGCNRYQPPTLGKDFWRQAPTILNGTTVVNSGPYVTNAATVAGGIQIKVGADGRPEEVTLLNPIGKPSKLLESNFRNQVYEPAVCDGKAVPGLLTVDFSH
jgi:hypothetical protein